MKTNLVTLTLGDVTPFCVEAQFFDNESAVFRQDVDLDGLNFCDVAQFVTRHDD